MFDGIDLAAAPVRPPVGFHNNYEFVVQISVFGLADNLAYRWTLPRRVASLPFSVYARLAAGGQRAMVSAALAREEGGTIWPARRFGGGRVGV